MMIAVGNDYATALFMLASEENKLDAYSKNLEEVCKLFRDEREYMDFLASPSIQKDVRTGALDEAFGGKIEENVLHFLQVLCEHNKIATLFDCVKEFELLRKSAEKTLDVYVTSAVKLDEESKKALIEKLEKKTQSKVLLNEKIDPSLIGGIIIEYDGQIMDGSIKRTLHNVKEVISK